MVMFNKLTKKEVEQQKFKELSGNLGIYACPNCKFIVRYLYIDSGITPAMIRCPCCKLEAYSQFSSIKQPTLMWYRPDTLEELVNLANYAAEKIGGDSDRDRILMEYVEHYNLGGLFARRIR